MADEWQSAFVEVVPDFSNFRSKTNAAITPVLSDAGDNGGRAIGSSMGAVFAGSFFGTILADLGSRILSSIVGAVRDGIEFGLNYAFESINLASGLEETGAAVEQIFGDAAAGIQAFGDTAVQVLGQTKQQALDATKTFGALGAAAGLQGDQLVGFSTNLVTLATDLASFNNTDVDTALNALRAGLSGEAEPLRQFQVFLNDATLKAKALELGIYDGNGALTDQQRILAANAAIFEKTTTQQGDFARTSSGFANQQKIFNAALLETQTALGTLLLPAATEFISILNTEFIPVLEDVSEQVGPLLADAMQQSIPAFRELLTAVTPLLPELIELSISALPAIVDLVKVLVPLLIDWAANTKSTLDVYTALSSFLAGDTTLVDLAATFGAAAGSMFEVNRVIVGALIGFNGALTSFVSGLVHTVQAIPGQILGAVVGFGSLLYSAGASLISGFIAGIQANVSRMIAAVLGPVNTIIAQVKKALGIKSPSKVFAEIGAFSAQGFFGGWADSMRGSSLAIPGVSVPSRSSSTAMAGGASLGVQTTVVLQSKGGIDLTQYIEARIVQNDMNTAIDIGAGGMA